jgi:hypothetical protein
MYAIIWSHRYYIDCFNVPCVIAPRSLSVKDIGFAQDNFHSHATLEYFFRFLGDKMRSREDNTEKTKLGTRK